MKAVYVAGPISSDNLLTSLNNIRKGQRASIEVLKAGYAVFCPFIDYQWHLQTPIPLNVYQENSIEWLKRSDAMLVLDGWGDSKGTLAEIRIASEQGIPIFYSIDHMLLKFPPDDV